MDVVDVVVVDVDVVVVEFSSFLHGSKIVLVRVYVVAVSNIFSSPSSSYCQNHSLLV